MQVFAYKMCNFFKKVFQCPPFRAIFFLCLYAMFDNVIGYVEGLDFGFVAVEEFEADGV